jgi:hypothetical protein
VKDRTKRYVKGRFMSFLVFIAVIAAFFVAMGVLAFLRHGACDRLDADRVSHLQPGHDTAGTGSIYVKGVGTDRSEITEYLEAVAAMDSAGC